MFSGSIEVDGVLFLTGSGEKRPVSYVRDGRYIVFEMENGGSFLYTEKQPSGINVMIWIAIGLIAVAATIVSITVIKKKKKHA